MRLRWPEVEQDVCSFSCFIQNIFIHGFPTHTHQRKAKVKGESGMRESSWCLVSKAVCEKKLQSVPENGIVIHLVPPALSSVSSSHSAGLLAQSVPPSKTPGERSRWGCCGDVQADGCGLEVPSFISLLNGCSWRPLGFHICPEI